MTNPRRFNEQETAQILERAAAAEQARAEGSAAMTTSSDRVRGHTGMTLQQLEEIATEVGLRPEDIRAAAQAVNRGDMVPTERTTFAGIPVGVSRTVTLERAMTDTEWEQLVVQLRETFQARGRLRHEGSFREWSNGNLHVMLEPTASGQQLRMTTRKGNAASSVFIGGAFTLAGVSMFGNAVTAAQPSLRLGIGVIIALIGAFTAVSTIVSLPKWARTRASQMEALAIKAAEIVDANP